MNYPQEMEELRKAIGHVDALRNFADGFQNRDWGLDLDALDEAKHALLARLGALVLEGERKAAP